MHEIRGVFRRRWKLLVFASLTMAILSVIGAYTLPRRYVSTTKILVQRDETLNPLVSFTMAVTLASEDRLRTFNEIIFSRRMSQVIIDSLRLGQDLKSQAERDALHKKVQGNIQIYRRGSDSFTISYADTDPIRAQRAAALIADYFIKTNTEVETRRNELTVQFFEKKLEDYRQKFLETQREFVSVLAQRVDSLPRHVQALYTQLEDINNTITNIDGRIRNYREALEALRQFPDSLHTETGKQTLFDLIRLDLPHAADLREPLLKYEDVGRRYTGKYPEVEALEEQILQFLTRMRLSIESEISKEQARRWELESKSSHVVDDIKRYSVVQKVDADKESNYDIYRRLYDEMKVKLEQARTTRDLGSTAANQYMILDPAIIPTEPTKPNRKLIIGGGVGLGLLLGVLSMIAAELLDTTVRSPVDLEKYRRPVIAFIPYAEYRELKE